MKSLENSMNEQILKLSNINSFLANLIGTKNHGVLKTLITIQFHLTNLNLTNLNPWTKWQVLLQWDWTWLWMWTRSSILWSSFKLWIYVDYGVLTQFGPNFWTNINSSTHILWNWITYCG